MTTLQPSHPATQRFVDEMLGGYIEAALFFDLDEDDKDNKGLTDSMIDRAREDCELFLSEASEDFQVVTLLAAGGLPAAQMGQDLWLTRNGHGTGFWDRDDDTYGNPYVRGYLNETTTSLGPCDIYKGDDGFLYFSN